MRFDTKVYRKSTHTNSYIHFFSYHSSEIKFGVAIGLFLRAFRLCSPQNLDAEINYIKLSLSNLAYPSWFIEESLNKTRKIHYSSGERNKWSKEGIKLITLPFNQRLKDVTSKLKEKDIKFVFHFKNTIKKNLCFNQFGNKKKNAETGVYIIKCSDCNLSYVGETGRKLSIRLEEHSKAVREFDNRSAIANHCWENDHRMDFKNSRFVYKDSNIKRRRAVEGVLIDSIPTVLGNKSFNSLDFFNSHLVLKEAKLLNFVKAANDLALLPAPDNPIIVPNPGAPDQGFAAEDYLPDGSVFVNNERGQAVRRSRRFMEI